MAVKDMKNDELVDHYYELKHLSADDEETAKYYKELVREMSERFAIMIENEAQDHCGAINKDCDDPGYTQILIKNNGESVAVSTKWDITIHCDSEEEQKHVMELLEKFDEQQIPKNDEVVIKIGKDTLKWSDDDYIVYKKDYLKKHYAAEIAFLTGEII